MELFIETLTGTAFELRVSPFETIMSVKAKIQRLEGIPVSQQHLIWQSKELDDDFCLHDYSIHDGATLKLVLALRGGPINTRRIPMEDSTLREMAEYMEANQDDIMEKLPGNRQVTLLVFREGDQLNFFRVVDRGDGTLSPLSESVSGTSAYNMLDDEEEATAMATAALDSGATSMKREKVEENMKTREKMSELRSKMENLTVTKKPSEKKKSKYHPLANIQTRHHLPASTRTFNRNICLPPVGVSPTANMLLEGVAKDAMGDVTAADTREEAGPCDVSFPSRLRKSTTTTTVDVFNETDDESKKCDQASAMPSLLLSSKSHPATTIDRDVRLARRNPSLDSDIQILKRDTCTPTKEHTDSSHYTSEDKDSLSVHIPPSVKSKYSYELGKELRGGASGATTSLASNPASSIRSYKDIVLDSLKGSMRANRYAADRKKDLMLESLSSEEARAMSGLLRQASIERLGASRIGAYATGSSSRTKLSSYPLGGAGSTHGADVSTHSSDHRLLSGRLTKLSSATATHRDVTGHSRLLAGSPSHRLPPVKPSGGIITPGGGVKKKTGHKQRCYFCAKKTGLANSYQCRCGKNYCTLHRYAEAHDCTFDYKTEGRKILEQANPVVSAPKLPKI